MDITDRIAMMRVGVGYRCDLRAELREMIFTQGLCTVTELAKMLDMQQSNLSAYLTGRIGLPYDRVEKVLWLLRG